MNSTFDPNNIIQKFSDHLSRRNDDFFDLVLGPKREVWFNAELISCLSGCVSPHLLEDYIVSGEIRHTTIFNILDEMQLTGYCNVPRPNFPNRQPDVFAWSLDNSLAPVFIECKLVDSVFEGFNDTILDLKKQLNEIRQDFKDCNVYGLVYVLHRVSKSCKRDSKGQVVDSVISYESFKTRVEKEIGRLMTGGNVSVYGSSIHDVNDLQSLKATRGKFNDQVSFGLLLLEAT